MALCALKCDSSSCNNDGLLCASCFDHVHTKKREHVATKVAVAAVEVGPSEQLAFAHALVASAAEQARAERVQAVLEAARKAEEKRPLEAAETAVPPWLEEFKVAKNRDIHSPLCMTPNRTVLSRKFRDRERIPASLWWSDPQQDAFARRVINPSRQQMVWTVMHVAFRLGVLSLAMWIRIMTFVKHEHLCDCSPKYKCIYCM